MLPWFGWYLVGQHWLAFILALMLLAKIALFAHLFNIGINVWPVDSIAHKSTCLFNSLVREVYIEFLSVLIQETRTCRPLNKMPFSMAISSLKLKYGRECAGKSFISIGQPVWVNSFTKLSVGSWDVWNFSCSILSSEKFINAIFSLPPCCNNRCCSIRWFYIYSMIREGARMTMY